MTLKTQAKVLRALQEQVVEPVGGAASVRVDVRVLAATNKDLPTEIRASRFREDLYFRLNVIPIFVPPLRDRADDVPRLAEYFMSELAREYGRRRKTFDPAAMSTLRRYPWPGNVREMRNVLERLMIMVPGDTIASSDLSFLDGGTSVELPQGTASVPLHEAREAFERDYILKALAGQQGNISRTADVLGVERSNLYRKMRAFGIAPRRTTSRKSRRRFAKFRGEQGTEITGSTRRNGDERRRTEAVRCSAARPTAGDGLRPKRVGSQDAA